MWDPYIGLKSNALPNSLRYHCVPLDRPWVYLGFQFNVGAQDDREGREGEAHFVEHLVSENVSGKRFEDLRDYFEAMGGKAMFGRTSFSATWYSCKVPVAAAPSALLLFGEMLLASPLSAQIEQQRRVIQEEISKQYPNEALFQLAIRPRGALLPGSRFSRFHRSLGYRESVANMAAAGLQEFYRAYYVPGNLHIVAVGGLDEVMLREWLAGSALGAAFEAPAKAPLKKMADVPIPSEVHYEVQSTEFYREAIDGTKVSVEALVPGAISHAAVKIFVELLNRKLFREVRGARQWSYAFSADYQHFPEFHHLMIGGSIVSSAKQGIGSVIDTCVRRVADDSEAFEEYRRGRITRASMYDPSGEMLMNDSLEDLRHFDQIKSIAQVQKDFSSVTMDEIATIAKHLTPDRRWTGYMLGR